MEYKVTGLKKSEIEVYKDIKVDLTLNGMQAALIKVMIDRIGDAAMMELLSRGTSIREQELFDMLEGGTGIEMAGIMKPAEWGGLINAIDLEARKIVNPK
ncbi:hypothetical protein LC76P1_00080 [Lysinibacillus phage LC76P1]|nr:hypothetical protein LC76P1_00080 [Lysinibacillus phage LC76P1]